MAQTKHEIQAILAEAGTEPRHRFGQNFMIDGNLVRLVAEAGEIAPGDRGDRSRAGNGDADRRIAGPRRRKWWRSRSIAIWRRCCGRRFAGRAKFQLIEGDALAGSMR